MNNTNEPLLLCATHVLAHCRNNDEMFEQLVRVVGHINELLKSKGLKLKTSVGDEPWLLKIELEEKK